MRTRGKGRRTEGLTRWGLAGEKERSPYSEESVTQPSLDGYFEKGTEGRKIQEKSLDTEDALLIYIFLLLYM